jgi:TM2 domain-containing membrane protein YozV
MKCYIHNDVEAVGTCTTCGKSICQDCAQTVDGRLVCKDCAPYAPGHTGSRVERDRKDPLVALLLGLGGGIVTGSLLFSLGQLYNGQVKKFIVLTILNACIGTIAAVIYILGCFTIVGICCCLPVFLIPLILYIYELYDAYDTAMRVNRGELIRDWLE